MKLILLFLTFLAPPAFATQDVTCWKKDCLKFGWTRTDTAHQTFTDYQCYRDGCERSGWITGGSQGLHHYTQCKDQNCFGSGWHEIDRDSQVPLRQTVCTGGDCLRNGWTIYSSTDRFAIVCIDNDCAKKGWHSIQSSGNRFAKCKPGGCFVEGWTESQSNQ